MLRFARLPLGTCVVILTAMLAAAALAMVATPRLQTISVSGVPRLDATVPRAFGDWKEVPQPFAQISVAQGQDNAFEQPYDQTVMRTYVDRSGETVMLALAWGERQRQDIKVHRPEVCYSAQGYPVLQLAPGAPIAVVGRAEPVPTVSMLAGGGGDGNSIEVVRYWIRIGDSYSGDGLKARWYILQEGLHGRIPDGILVRASQRIRSTDDVARAQRVMERFLADLTAALPPATRALLVR